MPAQHEFSPSSTVLITGANGHVAQWVIYQLLSLPTYQRPKIRATVRSDASAATLKSVFEDHISSKTLEIVQVADITQPGAFDDIIKGCTHVAHIASPMAVGSKDPENDLIIPAIRGTTSLLNSALSSETLESVVTTGSFASIFDPAYDLRPGYTYTPSDWSPLTYEQAADPNLDLSAWPERYRNFITYMASKKLAEEAIWDFYKKQKPNWRLAVVCPTYIAGPSVLPLTKGADSLSFSNGQVWKTASSKPDDKLFDIDFPNWVDARDVAKAHLLALNTPEANGQRFVLAPNKVSYADIAQIARDKCGMHPSTQSQPLNCFDVESKNCETILGIRDWVSFEDTICDMINQVQGSEKARPSVK